MDRILGGLYGASDNDDEQTRTAKANDFVSRVETGNKAEGYSTEEAVVNYANATQGLPDDEFEGIAADALSQLTPEQRREFTHVVKQQAGIDLDDNTDDPRELAGLAKQLRAGSGGGDLGGLLGGLLGGGGGGTNDIMGALGGLLGGGSGAGTGGLGATGAQGTSQAGISGLLSNPIVKMVLGLIAAEAMKRMMGGGGQATQSTRITPSGSAQADSGGGLLDSLFGGGNDDNRKQEGDSGGGGGILDALFGGGDDEKDTSTRKTTVDPDADIDLERIKDDQRKKSI
jgi:hypothetical protein